jgi:hypothetical protein
MHILFDSFSSQVQVHRRLSIRMNTLLGAIQSEGWTYSFSRNPITTGQLDGCDVFAILTREQLNFDGFATNPNESAAFAYTPDEIKNILSFVENGGGVLLISNHGPYKANPKDKKLGDTKYDVHLAKAFGVIINPAHFNDGKGNTLMTMNTKNDSLNSGLNILFQVTEIAVHNSCGIQGTRGTPWEWIAKIPNDAIDNSGHIPKFKPYDKKTKAQQHYAIRLKESKVIVAGNSGLAGDDGCTIPAPGTILYGNNLLFLLNCFKWLGGIKPKF